LHDIGKAIDHKVEGTHAAIGADYAKRFGEHPRIVQAIATHHDDGRNNTLLGVLVQAADTLSAARPGARREMLETYVKRLEGLEKIANSFNGVDKCFAIQAGREIRILVENEKISENDATMLCKDICKKIEAELTYPGQIKVTVIRNARSISSNSIFQKSDERKSNPSKYCLSVTLSEVREGWRSESFCLR